MTSAILILWMAAIPLIFSPGPANLSLASVGVAYGFRRGVPYLTGIVLGTIAILVLVSLGATAIILAHPMLRATLTIIGAAYILFLAWKIAWAPLKWLHPYNW